MRQFPEYCVVRLYRGKNTLRTKIGTHAKNKTNSLHKRYYNRHYDKSGKPPFPCNQHKP